MTRRRRLAAAFRPLPAPALPVSALQLGRKSLASSVSALALAVTGAMSVALSGLVLAQPARAQDAPATTLPGTQPLQGGRWVGARLPTVAQGNGGLVMTIKQEQERALLDWQRFDVGATEEVVFDQQETSWVALNRIFDNRPSEIAGKITAKGQVWLQNTNGILFKDGAQINAHTILATALPIREEQLYGGLLSGSGVIRGTTADPLFPDMNRAFVPKPVQDLDPTKLLEQTWLGGENATVLDLLARAAIRMAILRKGDMEGLNAWDANYGVNSISNVDRGFSANGLSDVMETIVASIDLSEMGEYDYENFKSLQEFWNGVSWQGVPPRSQLIPQSLRDEIAAQIRTQFIDNYAALVANAQQRYDNYVVNSRVVVERGARLTATSTDTASPGKIMLFGPNVSNAGTLQAHDGQVILAAGEMVKLSSGQGFTNSLRGGLAVNVSATPMIDDYGSFPGMPCCQPATYAAWEAAVLDRVADLGMSATNSGEIRADRGAVSMTGAEVNQMGSILVTNGVRQRTGAIVLQASHGFNNSQYSVGGNYFGGSLTLGENSVTRITPDLSSLTGLAADTFAKGRVLLAGTDILLDRGAEVTSRSGDVIIHANPVGSGARGGSSPGATDGSYMEQAGDDGSFTMRAGARIDVSGLKDVERSVADNVFAVEVRSNEVSASPRQRDGILIGETVYVDRRRGATIVDWTGALAGELRTAQQMSTEGGSVDIRASDFAVIEDGATIDVSGGSTRYTDAEVTLTRLRDSFGRFHAIADADPNLKYVGIDQSKSVMKGYTEGADAGAVQILSGSARMFGKLRGDVVIGDHQLLAAIGQATAPRVPVGAVGANYIATPAMPKLGSAVLHRGGPEYGPWSSRYSFVVADENAFTGTLWTETVPNGPFESETMELNPLLIGQDWSEYEGDQPERVVFIEDDFFAGMGSVSLSYGSSHHTQTINSGVQILLGAGGSFGTGSENGIGTVGDNVSIIAPSGEITLGAANGMTLGNNVHLSVAAQWINDADAPAGLLRGFVDGGSINLLGALLTGNVKLDAGGGGWYQRTSPATQTGPGTFNLIAGKRGDIQLGQNGMSVGEILDTVDINLAGLDGGGLLALLATGDVVIGPDGGSSDDAEYLDETMFRDMGVGTLGLGATTLRVLSGANLLFQARNMMFDGSPIDIATGTDLRDVTELVLLPDHLRSGGGLNLTANSVVIEAGALVQVDALGTVSINGGAVEIDGTVRAHGGVINVSPLSGVGPGTVRLGDTALLDATGVAQTVKVPGGADGRGFWFDGRVVDGGKIYIEAENVVMAPGALLDVSGASGLLSVWQPGRYGLLKVNQTVGSDAGAIEVRAAGGYLLGNLRGDAGSINNYGGTLTLNGGRNGNLLLPEYSDWNTGKVGLQSILDSFQYMFWPEPTPENPVSLRTLFEQYSYLAGTLGFGPADIEDIQITNIAEFQDFLRVALMPSVQQAPEDVAGAFVLDPTLTALPDGPPPVTGKFAIPGGYTPDSEQGFDRAMRFILMAIGNANADQLVRGSRLTAGAHILEDMKTFDTLSVIGSLESDQKIDISSKRVLNVAGGFNGVADMSFSSRNVYLGGIFEANGPGMAPKTSGTLTIKGDTIEIGGQFAVGGFETVVVEAQGDMRGGYGAENNPYTPGIITSSDLVLRAAQIYPTTGGILQFDSTSSIRVEQTGRREAPLSAGGTLILNAPRIEQAGTLRAPFGEIRLTATGVTTTAEDGTSVYTPGTVDLFAGSITSTAADGRTILYGYTYDGQSWFSPTSLADTPELSTPPEKRVSLTGDDVNVREGALIDVSGGGDVLGLEFVAGPMGQANVLEGSGVYAIVPAYGNEVIAPIDPLYNPGSSAGEGIGLGSSVWLAGFDGHAAGWYTLLPAEYALTPGGYRITLAEDLPTVGDARAMGDGSFAVLGRRGLAGTDIADQSFSTFRVEKGADVRLRSEFFETYGNSFFSSERFLQGLQRSGNPYNADPRLPVDGGFLTLAANRTLELDGTIRAGGVEGARGGIVDITSDNIVIAAPGTDVSDLDGYLVLDPNKISNIAESLLIGGIRRQGAAGLEIVVGQETRASADEPRTAEKSIGAENVIIRTDVDNPLVGTELMFAANLLVRAEAGSVVRAEGDGADAPNLAIAPSLPQFTHPWDPGQNAPAADWGGAFLRVSNLGDITVSRRSVQSHGGDMIVDAGATIQAIDAVLLDSTENTIVGSGATVKAGAITAAAGLVSLGLVPEGAEGLVFTGETLEGLTKADKLTLKSYSTFDFYGDVTLNLTGAVALDGAALVDRGDTPGTVDIAAHSIEFRNSDAAAVDATGAGGTLKLTAANIVIGDGLTDVAFGTSEFTAGERLILSELGENRFDGDVTIRAAEIVGTSGAGHQVIAEGALELLSSGATVELPAFASAGALLDFTGATVNIADTVVRAGSGTVRATATEGDVTVSGTALINVAGSDVSFFEIKGFLPGGSVQLTSVEGDVLVADGATIDISGGQAGGDAGSLILNAGRGIAQLGGTLKAEVADGYRGGAFGLTTSTLADFGGLNALLNEAGFSRSRDFAILDGDVTLNGTTRVDALRIVTGTGDINVAADAVIGSDSAKGGSILLASGGDLILADGAKFDVSAKGTDERGGAVELQVALTGTISAGAATIDVSGKGSGGRGQVRLRAPQIGGDVGVERWSAIVTGGNTQLEAFRVYELGDADGDAANGFLAEIDTALQDQVIADATAFMDANGTAIRGRLGQTGNANFLLVPGIELRSEGDLDLVHNWNLKDARFGGQGGVLTLRAGGDLTVNANLSDGFKSATPSAEGIALGEKPYGWLPGDDELPAPLESKYTDDNTWSYNLVGGADFAQTNVLATRGGGTGDVVIGGIVRTGTGDIAVSAAGDLAYEAAYDIRYQFDYNSMTRVTVPAGTPMVDGTVLKPTTYPSYDGATRTVYPRLPADTVLREGSRLPAGTVMPDGSVLAVDTVLTADVKLTSETTFPGDVVIAGKTRLGSDLVWDLPGHASGDPSAPTVRAVLFSIPGLGDVGVSQPVGGIGGASLTLPDGRGIGAPDFFNFEAIRLVEMMNGAIYTVGREDVAVPNYNEKTLVGFVNSNQSGMIIDQAYRTGAGDISIDVGGSVIGTGAIIENYRWLLSDGTTPASSLFGYQYPGKDPNAPFNDELIRYEPDRTGQTSLSLLADYFRQGVGALGGGDVSITSGGNVDNLLVAVPTWVRVAGGTSAVPTKTLHVSGGGDLVMNVGQNLTGGLVQMGKGRATIDVAGSVLATDQRYGNLQNPVYGQYLHLAIDDVQLSLQAGGDVYLRGFSSTLGVPTRPYWLGYTEDTSVRVTSLGGDINYLGLAGAENAVNILPSQSAFVATAGSITLGSATVDTRIAVDAWPETRLDLLAQEDIHFRLAGSYDGGGLTIGYGDPLWVPRAINPGGEVWLAYFQSTLGQNGLTGAWTFNQAGPGFGIDGLNVHSGSDSFSRIYAANGDVIGWNTGNYEYQPGNGMHGGGYTFGHETRLKAGNNIRMGAMTFITHDGSDVPVLEAGGSVYLPNAVLYGPGRLWVQAGDEIWMGRTNGQGIRAREAVSAVATSTPLNGGSISVLAGIDQEPEYEAFFDYYLDPENLAEAPTWLRQHFVEGDRPGLTVPVDVVLADGTTKTTVYAIELVNYMRGLRGEEPIETEAFDEKSGSRPIAYGKLAREIDPSEYAEALEAFKALDPVLQRPLAVRILNAEVKTSGREAVGRSPDTDGRYVRLNDPTRGYDAVGRLFPGAERMSQAQYDALSAERQQAIPEHLRPTDEPNPWSGNIEMMVSQIRGESGGHVDLLAPGGSIQLASLSISNTSPGDAGIVTQRGGGVNVVAYGDYIVNQSRTMTADDGDILIWSSYGNIDAGRGRKTSLSVPPVAFPIDAWGTTRVQLSGLPNGAGIATLDQVDGKQGGDVDLYAFNGIVNAGDAGIRASRDLFIGAIEIRGLDNITVGGETNVDLGTDEGTVGALNLENFAQAMEDEAIAEAFDMTEEVEKLRTVRQTILTGSVVSFGIEGDGQQPRQEEEDDGQE